MTKRTRAFFGRRMGRIDLTDRIEATSAAGAAWKVVDRQKLEPEPPRSEWPARRVYVYEKTSGCDWTGEWEFRLIRCTCGQPVLYPVNVFGTDPCHYHLGVGGGDEVTLGEYLDAAEGA